MSRKTPANLPQKAPPRKPSIDVGLAVISAITPLGYSWRLEDMAEVCGCTRQMISAIERKALRKLYCNKKTREILLEMKRLCQNDRGAMRQIP